MSSIALSRALAHGHLPDGLDLSRLQTREMRRIISRINREEVRAERAREQCRALWRRGGNRSMLRFAALEDKASAREAALSAHLARASALLGLSAPLSLVQLRRVLELAPAALAAQAMAPRETTPLSAQLHRPRS